MSLLPRRHILRTLLVPTGIAVVATLLAPAVAFPAHAGQVTVVPTSRVLHVVGHGWGHGHGMSQDGANGAASVKHMSASQIVSFYYPHTSAGAIGNPTMRILLQATATNYVDVGKPTGASAVLSIHDFASGYRADLPASSPKWRFTTDATVIKVWQFVNNTWQQWQPAGHPSFGGPINVGYKNATAAAPTRVLYPSGTERDYRGYLQVVHAAANNLDALAIMPMEDYLRGVVPRESPSSWPAAALQAQAIAARSYAEYEREHAGTRDYDICDTTSCQVFGGTTEIDSSGHVTNLEAASSDSAVKATAGQIRTYGGKAIFAQYCASDGGWTTDGGAPYLIAQADPYDGLSGSSSHTWFATVPASALESANPSIGSLVRVRVTQRDGNGQYGGRVLQAVLQGTKASVTVSGQSLFSAYSWPTHSTGMRSAWWDIVPTPPADFLGDSTSDPSVWRGSQGRWYVSGHGSVVFGQNGDDPVPGDYDGDGAVERAVWRPSSGRWYVEGVATSTHWGQAGDIPVPADYNGDGRTDFAVFRPSVQKWYIYGIANIVWGHSTDVPVPGDYNGDGIADIAMWRASTGHWYVRGITGSPQWGTRGDIPVPGDYTGAGATQRAIWRPSNGRWYVNDGRASFPWGVKGDVPVPGDYDGDAVTQAATYRPSTGTWYRHGFSSLQYGVSTDEPLPLPYAIYRVR